VRRILYGLLSLLATALLLGGLGAAWGYRLYTQPGPLASPVLFTIEKGESVRSISARLATEAKAVGSPYIIAAASRLPGASGSLKAGEYNLQPSMSARDILAMLQAGLVYQRKFTIPEGLTSRQIVRMLDGVEGLEGTVETIPPEGSLLPETYNFVRGDTRQDKIDQMQNAMRQTLDELQENKPGGGPLLSEAEAVILASIVEKETAVSFERRKIAGVFINRLNTGMKLQTDPTVIYALTSGDIKEDGQGPLGRRLLAKDLQTDSPYNTYKYAGLPPGPIANPGRESLMAVMDPEKHDYYYFVADGTGGHVFATTLEEHNRNVAKWRKIREKGVGK